MTLTQQPVFRTVINYQLWKHVGFVDLRNDTGGALSLLTPGKRKIIRGDNLTTSQKNLQCDSNKKQ